LRSRKVLHFSTSCPVVRWISHHFLAAIKAISPIGHVDLPVVLFLLRGPIASGFQKSSLGFGSLNAHVCNCEQIGHHLGLLHGYLLHSLDVADPITKGIDDLNVLDVWDSVPSIAKTFHAILEAFIVLLLDGLQGLSSGWTLVRALKVPDEHGTQLVLGVDRSF
jgi:hypothetical protein